MSLHPVTGLLLVASVVLLSAGCHTPPAEIWVPGDDYSETLLIDLPSTEVRVGQWLELEAERRTGPWVRVRLEDELPDGNCWWRKPPPSIERGVGARLRWFVEPESRFNLPTAADGFRRRVRFDRAGTYTIRAQSAGCPGPFGSAPQTVRVLP